MEFKSTINGTLGGKSISRDIDLKFSDYGCNLQIKPRGHGSETIGIYVFNYRMLPSIPDGEVEYKMLGPNLGFHTFVDDVREMPPISHVISGIRIRLKQLDNMFACSIYGSCNLAHTRYSRDCVNPPREGLWIIKFKLELLKNTRRMISN